MQPSWYSLSSWPHIDITPLGRSVTCTFLASPFFTAEMFLGYHIALLENMWSHSGGEWYNSWQQLVAN